MYIYIYIYIHTYLPSLFGPHAACLAAPTTFAGGSLFRSVSKACSLKIIRATVPPVDWSNQYPDYPPCLRKCLGAYCSSTLVCLIDQWRSCQTAFRAHAGKAMTASSAWFV